MQNESIVLCDTGVLIRMLRSDIAVLNEVNHIGLNRLAVSSITVGELLRGVKKKRVMETLGILSIFKKFPITPEICRNFEYLMLHYRGKGPNVPDCLIAATSLSIDAALYTFNPKHFSFYQGLTLYEPQST